MIVHMRPSVVEDKTIKGGVNVEVLLEVQTNTPEEAQLAEMFAKLSRYGMRWGEFSGGKLTLVALAELRPKEGM